MGEMEKHRSISITVYLKVRELSQESQVEM